MIDLDQPCRDEQQLWNWMEHFLQLRVPRQAVCPGHHPPFDYIRRAYFEPACDQVVWAPRGGGKTQLGAAATFLDLLHKPGVQICLLGGSLEQSLRMWNHLQRPVSRWIQDRLQGKHTARRIVLDNGSVAGVLAQSQRSVRGVRVQKLRCDEVELFDPRVWEAAQLATRSAAADDSGQTIAGVIEAFSTLHESGGLMSQIVQSAQEHHIPVVRWCLLEVLQRCAPERDCQTCGLHEDCRGVAKLRCEGFVSIDDALAMKQRVSRQQWETEMLCRRPRRSRSVFPTFLRAAHVVENLQPRLDGPLCLAIDFGFANPFACLWIGPAAGGQLLVLDEYVRSMLTLEQHCLQLDQRPWGMVRDICCDPAGNGRNDQTALSNVQLLRARGHRVRFGASRIVEGLELIRRDLDPAIGPPRLLIDARCQNLITALENYRYADNQSELPLKDGVHDHLIDALRYYYVNHNAQPMAARRY